MQEREGPPDPGRRPKARKTPAERAQEFAAVQARLKGEAAARRAAARNVSAKASPRSVTRGRQRSGG